MVKQINTREVSYLVLKKVLDDGIPLDRAVETLTRDGSPVDRGFVRNLTATTIRRLGQLDKIINHCTKKKLGNTQMAIRHVLRLGICQLLFTGVPAHAAVNTSVELVDKRISKKLQYLKNTVNAVLRHVDRERDALLKKFGNSRHNFPKWLLASWDKRYGLATVKEIIALTLCEAPLDITLKPGLDSKIWAERLNGEPLADGGIRIAKAGNIPSLDGYEDGVWWVQDVAARIPADLLSVKEGSRVLDLCAAPGGKAAQSAAKGARVTAVDLSERRIARLKQNMDRLNLQVDVVTSDVLDFGADQLFDHILLDAPCSSTGTIRRHPEILHTRSSEDVFKLARLQAQLLDHTASLLNEGGELVYCVCSMEAEEGPEQIKALLTRHGSLKRKKITEKELPGLAAAITADGDVQTLPNMIKGGMDGFFISRLVKT